MTTTQATDRMLFVNLPVSDPTATRRFWEALGFTVNEAFSDERATSVQLNALTSVMFLEHAYFHSFHGTTAPESGTGALYCLSAGSADDVRDLVERALALGGSPAAEPQDDGPMFGWSFRDLDGHLWEVMWMDPAALG
ncbi:VOC family protein [Nocardioides zeae]